MSPDMIGPAVVDAIGFAFFCLQIGIDAVPSSAGRGALFVVWVAAIWMAGEWSRRRIGGN